MDPLVSAIEKIRTLSPELAEDLTPGQGQAMIESMAPGAAVFVRDIWERCRGLMTGQRLPAMNGFRLGRVTTPDWTVVSVMVGDVVVMEILGRNAPGKMQPGDAPLEVGACHYTLEGLESWLFGVCALSVTG